MSFLYKEITQWETTTPNHIYIFKDVVGKKTSKTIGYIKENSEEVFWFSKPLNLDLKNRKFIRVCNS
jgi:hypothetical protein